VRSISEVRLAGLELLDVQLSDRDERLCGKVDDVELSEQGGRLVVAALLSGPGAWPNRLPGPLRELARRLLSARVVRIPIAEVGGFDGSIRLNKPAAELGLGLGEEPAARWLARVPGNDTE
jgi:hypothetical protein